MKLLEFQVIKNKKEEGEEIRRRIKKVREMGSGVRRRRGSFACFNGHSSTPNNSTELWLSLPFVLVRASLWFLRRRFEANLSWLCVLNGSFYNLIIKAYSITFPKNTFFFLKKKFKKDRKYLSVPFLNLVNPIIDKLT